MFANRQNLMILAVLLVAFLSYSCFLYTALPVKYIPARNDADRGKLTWQKYNCNACHQVYGLGGYLGPDLTNVYSRRGKAYIRAFLKTGTASMPDFHLPDREMTGLINFLKAVDESGKGDPKTYSLNYDGTIEQQ